MELLWTRLLPASRASLLRSRTAWLEVRAFVLITSFASTRRATLEIIPAGAVDDVFARVDELYASSKDLMDEVCPTFMDHVGAWAEAVESGAAAPTSASATMPESSGTGATVSSPPGGASRDVVEDLTNAVFGFSIEASSDSVKTMKALLEEVRISRGRSVARRGSSLWHVYQAETAGAAVDPAISSVARELVAIEEGMSRGSSRSVLWQSCLCEFSTSCNDTCRRCGRRVRALG